jgi:NitT/TauT family transport system substrate-binding protein
MFRLLRTILVALTAGTVFGLQPTPTFAQGGKGKPEKTHIRVGIIPISNLTPLYAAQKLGFFKDAGMTVETSIGSSGPALAGGLIGGSLDFVYTNYVSVIQAATQGFELMVVAHQNSAQESPPDAAPLVVRNDGSISKPSDLAGKSIAINALNNINRIAAQYYLERHGVKGEKLKFVEVPFPNMGDALIKGQVDAAAMVEPFVTFMVKSGKLKALGYPFLEVRPGLDIAGFVAARKFVRDNPVVVERFVAALARANDYLNGNAEARIALTAEFTKSKPELIKQLTLDRWSHTVNVKDLQTLSNLSYEYGLQKAPFKVDDLIYKTAKKQ